MSEHVKRAEPNHSSYYILFFGLLCVLAVYIYDAYKKPRTLYIEATPKSASLYIENELVCETLPCEITQQYMPQDVWVQAKNHYTQKIPITLKDYFSNDELSFTIALEAFPKSIITWPAPKKETAAPNDVSVNRPSKRAAPKQDDPKSSSFPKPSQKDKLPMECLETARERQAIQNRAPVLCYYEDDKAVTYDATGECYASFWVSAKGRVQKFQWFGCMHDELIEPATAAFKNRIYLPGLRNGKPVERAVETEIKYGPNAGYITLPESDLSAPNSLNGDAQILSCPEVTAPKSMTRSGHCIFEFDLSREGHISHMRQTRCTHAEIMIVTSSAFKQCQFKAARTDGVNIERPYMKYQIDIDIYDKRGRKIPVHASFGDKSDDKPYITY